MTQKSTSEPVIGCGIHKSYDDLEVLRGVDIRAHEGDVISLIGSSGRENRPCCAASICWKSASGATFSLR